MANVVVQYCFFMGLGPKFLDSGSQPSLNGLPKNLHTSFMWGQALKPTSEKKFSPPLKSWQGKTSNFADLPSIGSK